MPTTSFQWTKTKDLDRGLFLCYNVVRKEKATKIPKRYKSRWPGIYTV